MPSVGAALGRQINTPLSCSPAIAAAARLLQRRCQPPCMRRLRLAPLLLTTAPRSLCYRIRNECDFL